MKVKIFVFNDFQENTYVLSDQETKKCIIVDPGCNNSHEKLQITDYIANNNLIPQYIVNTHCHIDHILGNRFIADKYKLDLYAHKGEIPVLQSGEAVAKMYGVNYITSPEISHFVDEGMELTLGNHTLDVLFCPGHSPASICLYNKETHQLIAGDVLFHRSIGRTDLPGGDYDTLINSIRSKLMVLPDEVHVYPGHGVPTKIGDERLHNPFLI